MTITTLNDRELQMLRRLSVGRCTERDFKKAEFSSISVARWLARLVAAGMAQHDGEGYAITAAGLSFVIACQQAAAHPRRVCNSASKDPYTGAELGYRGRV